MKIAVIPARGGSKRIPRKNIRNFCGKPMITWSIDTAKNSRLFEHVIVSTDDDEIGGVAMKWGAEVPFMRPPELSNDHAATTEVVAHATRWALAQGWPVSAVCCLYATAPFVQVEDLKRGLLLLESGERDFAFAVTRFEASIFRSFKQTADGGIEMLFPEYFSSRSQDLPETFHDAGQFYWGRPSAWIEGKRDIDRGSAAVAIPRWRVHDIDGEEDWVRAEFFAKWIQHRGAKS